VVVIQGKTDAGDVLGSGFILSKDGKIVTNLHVIADMKTANVQLANGEVFDSISVLAADERRDLAIVQIAGFNLPVLDLGDSDLLTVGESVVIVGSPRGLEGTLTAGILSSIRDSGGGFKVLQTDAAVNPGNSGGPLVNNKGQAIGVVSFKLRSAESLNFALPINYVSGLLNNLHEPISLGQMRKGFTGDKANAIQEDSGRSLKETLDLLRDILSHETFSFVTKTDGEIVNVSETFALDSESCAPTFNTLMSFRNSSTSGWSPKVTMLRVRVPLREITGGSVNKGEIYPNISSGDKLSYNLIISSKTQAFVMLETPNQPEAKDTDFIFLPFHDEVAANRALALALNAGDICRKPGPEPTISSPSLKDTLEWLKENIPLGTVNYTTSTGGTEISMNEQSAVYSLDSCTATFGRVVTITIVNRPQHQSVGTYRVTMPLGVISSAIVVSMDSLEGDAKAAFGSGGGYRVVLMSKSKSILATDHPPNNQLPITQAVDTFILKFSDESMANRVGEAFRHAADLCRKKDLF
jgi:hypothetical protein